MILNYNRGHNNGETYQNAFCVVQMLVAFDNFVSFIDFLSIRNVKFDRG